MDLLDGLAGLVRSRAYARRRIQRDCRKLLAPRHPVAVLEYDPPEPSGKCRRLAQIRQAAIRLDERFLSRIFGQVEVPQDRVRVAARHVLEPADDLAVGVQISRSGTDDQ